MSEIVCTCNGLAPHTHGIVTAPNGNQVPAIIYCSDHHPRAEVHDSETGEVIFTAKKGPLRIVR